MHNLEQKQKLLILYLDFIFSVFHIWRYLQKITHSDWISFEVWTFLSPYPSPFLPFNKQAWSSDLPIPARLQDSSGRRIILTWENSKPMLTSCHGCCWVVLWRIRCESDSWNSTSSFSVWNMAKKNHLLCSTLPHYMCSSVRNARATLAR